MPPPACHLGDQAPICYSTKAILHTNGEWDIIELIQDWWQIKMLQPALSQCNSPGLQHREANNGL